MESENIDKGEIQYSDGFLTVFHLLFSQYYLPYPHTILICLKHSPDYVTDVFKLFPKLPVLFKKYTQNYLLYHLRFNFLGFISNSSSQPSSFYTPRCYVKCVMNTIGCGNNNFVFSDYFLLYSSFADHLIVDQHVTNLRISKNVLIFRKIAQDTMEHVLSNVSLRELQMKVCVRGREGKTSHSPLPRIS